MSILFSYLYPIRLKRLYTKEMDQLIHAFSTKILADFFKKAISSFKIETEDINHYIEDKDFGQFSELTRIGNVSFKNSDELIVFACKYNGILSERSSKKKQFEIAKLVLKEDFKDGAIFVFYDESGKFRFSFIRRNWDGKADKKYSSWKRFTYFIDPKDHNKTFRQRIGNCTFKDLDSIQEAFSVEKLTKEFYNDLFKWYQWTLTTEVGITFPNDTATTDDDRVKLEEQMIRLITRLLFVWFIKQKHLVPDDLFKTDKLSEILKNFDPSNTSDGSYYNAILQNLFFATLNKAVTEREFAKLVDKRDIKTRYRYAEMFNISEEEVLNLFRPIPFLNGGLFECLDKEESTDGIKYHLDGFSRNSEKAKNGNFKHRAFIPNCVFFGNDKHEGLIPLLERYNFTVEENVPNEVQVALDPELLGNVFENLLGAFNPETQESARKQSGSFYTPKEIVAYMVDESLIAYLNNSLPDLNEALIHQLFEQDILPSFLANNHLLCEKIAQELRSVKILDPACGSGAFPMGILNRMVEVLEKLDAKNKASHHDLKLHLIEECIYGVDIQTIAAQISKLRFFISLIVEQEAMDISKPEENYGVLTLPNLETKFVAANTLIGMKKKKEGDFVNSLFTDPRIDETKHQLMEVRKEHFYAKSAYKKKELRDKDAILRVQLSKLLQDNNEFAPEDAIQFSQWNPYDQNASSPFFDPEWMFGLEEGFDVVIGNPPYLRIQGIRDTNSAFADFLTKTYKAASGSFDLYTVFVEKSLELINSNGVVNFIMPTKWTNAAFGKGLRGIISEKSAANKIINFGAYQVFNASTYTGLQLFKPNSPELLYFELDRDLKSNGELAQYLQTLKTEDGSILAKEKLTKEIWTLTSGATSKIIDKLNLQPRRISDVFEKIFQGLATSKDDVYFIYDAIVDKNKVIGFSKQLNRTIEIERDFVKPLLKGEDVHKYEKITTNRFVVFPYKLANGNAELYKEDEIKNLFPLGYSYLKECEVVLRDREKGRFNIDGEWFQFGRKQGINFAEKEKLVAPEISLGGNFCYDENGQYYSTTTIYGYIKKEEISDSYKSLMAILNSKLLWWYLVNTGTVLANGYFRFKPNYLKPFPMPNISPEKDYLLETLVNQILDLKQNNPELSTKNLEEQIDEIIFEMYHLTEDEKVIIKNI